MSLYPHTRRAPVPARQRGISLIEALIAMAIMAFGMLGVLGMQATLRGNGDVAKQRSEAVRIAQAGMEDRRSFSLLDTRAGSRAFADIQPVASSVAAQANANTVFNRVQTVVSYPQGDADTNYLAARKTVKIEVNWLDRNDVVQRINLSSIVAGSAPEMAVALATPAVGSSLQSRGGRHLFVPAPAVDLGNGTSRFEPPGGAAAGGVSWIFSNVTGSIMQTCLGGVCTNFTGRLLAGFIRFSTSPTEVDARNPSSPRLPGVSIDGSMVSPEPPQCFLDDSNINYLTYFCAVRFISVANPWWSGRVNLSLGANRTATSVGNVSDPGAFRVCRYSPARTNEVTTPPVANHDHPFAYFEVKESLLSQNFLVMSAALPRCPDDTELPARTMDHQPAS